ncbi:DeoR/GlpR family DNA-binding transcription regulator [Oceaniferula marina]|uniref:DeoR/GlpR family DNA-binding transcription regulator n=1 Tax=Oceaniferula marina TaxID=2748318 RepID=UPI0015C0AB05|nr:DeoR/GlpR family DNA-binding transcription regulator [Oceaniferula marina]
MLAAERHHQILKTLSEQGSVRTKEIASLLSVTDETIRKDFEVLENQGFLVRTHGGAIPPKRALRELSLTERQLMNREAKNEIAKAAAQRIQPKETIFIDASSTALSITQYLPDFPITVVTNAHDVVSAVGGMEQVDLVSTGGLYEARSRSFIGAAAEKTLLRYNIHRMFFSGNGLDLQRGVSEGNSRQAAFKEHVIECAEDVCFLADATKIGQCSAFFFADCSQLSTLITSKGADPLVLEAVKNVGVDVISA